MHTSKFNKSIMKGRKYGYLQGKLRKNQTKVEGQFGNMFEIKQRSNVPLVLIPRQIP